MPVEQVTRYDRFTKQRVARVVDVTVRRTLLTLAGT
jgi:hypothetical protein